MDPVDGAKSELAMKLDRLFEMRRKADEPQMSNKAAAAAIREKTGVSMSHVYLWGLRNGSNTNPTLLYLRAIADYFGVDPSYLVDPGFDEKIEAELKLVTKMRDVGVRGLALRGSGLTAKSLNSVSAILDTIRQLEQLPPVVDEDIVGNPD